MIAAVPFAHKQKKVVAKVCLFASNFPGLVDYKDLPSGKVLKDMKIAFIVKVWKADKIAQNRGGEIEEYMTDIVCDDMAIYDNLPINWWLDNKCICYLLATLVCQDLPDISNKPESVPAGATRTVQRKRSAEEDKKEKAIEKHNKKVDKSTATDQKLKEATILGMKGAAIKQRVVTMIEKQIELLERTKSVLIARWGQDKYDNCISELMTKMLDDCKMSGEDLMGVDDMPLLKKAETLRAILGLL